MTNIQAINLLKGLEQSLDDYCELNDEGKTAFGMAITALELFGNSEQLPSAQPEKRTEERMETHACDLISRQAAIDALKGLPTWWADGGGYYGGAQPPMVALLDPEDAVSAIENLPSEQPEYRLDEWCTDCKEYDTEKHCCPRFNQVIRTTLNEMKSERKKGKWIYNSPVTMKCDQCGFVIKDWDWHRFKFCPNCDCDMRGEQE